MDRNLVSSIGRVISLTEERREIKAIRLRKGLDWMSKAKTMEQKKLHFRGRLTQDLLSGNWRCSKGIYEVRKRTYVRRRDQDASSTFL